MAPDHLTARIRRIRWRIRVARTLERGCEGLWVALLLACGLVAAERLLGIGVDLGRTATWTIAAGAVAGAVWGFSGRVTSVSAAVLADQRLGLRERLSSAVLLAEEDGRMVQAQRADAREHASRLRPREAVPISVPRRAKLVTVSAASLLLITLFLPRLDLLHRDPRSRSAMVERRQIEQQANRLREVERRAAASSEIRPATAVVELSREIKRISEELKRERVDRVQALAKVSSLSDKVEQERRKLLGRIGVDRNAFSSHQFDQAGNLAAALLNREFDKASSDLRGLAGDLRSGRLSDEEKASLAAEMERLADLIRQNPLLSKALVDMARAIRSEDIEAVDLSLGEALESLADLEDVLEQLVLLDGILQDVALGKLALAGRIGSCTACGGGGMCGACGGSRKCPGCNGSGQHGQGGTCSICGGSGVCPFCGGGGVCPGCGGVGLGVGRGIGPRPIDDSAVTSFRDERVPGRLRPGRILAAIRVKGQQVRGESDIEVVDGFREFRQTAEQALAVESIPISMKNRVKAYFDAIDPSAPAAIPAETKGEENGNARR